MITISVQRVSGSVHVRVSRWPREGRYPVQLADFVLADQPAESELGLVARAARAVELECEARRHEEQPELSW